MWPVLWPAGPNLGDHFVFWSAGRMVLEGRSPYDPTSWSLAAARFPDAVIEGAAVNVIPNWLGTRWNYPPWTALLFVPFGAMPVAIGTFALHLAYIVAGAAAALLLAAQFPWRSRATYALALAIFGTYQPFVMGTRGGHFGSFILLGVALAFRGSLRSGASLPIGAVLAAAKPHIVSAFALAVAGRLIGLRRKRALAAAALAVASVALATFARYPEALLTIPAGVAERIGDAERFSSTWAVANVFAAGFEPLFIVLFAGGVVLISLLAVRLAPLERRPHVLLACSLAVSLAISPYVQSYDAVVLLPAAFVALHAAELAPLTVRLALVGLTIVVVTLVPWLAILGQMMSGQQAWSGVLPLLFALLLLAAAAVPARAR